MSTYNNGMNGSKVAAIACLCNHDIDEHLLGYNETTEEFSSGACVKKDCLCSRFRLVYYNVPITVAQMERLRNPFTFRQGK